MEEHKIFIREVLSKRFTWKEKSIGSPERHLGNKESLVTLENGVKCWNVSSSQHVQAAVKNLEHYRSRSNLGTLFKDKSPWTSNRRMEADIIPELTPTKACHFQSLIRVLWYIVELGRWHLAMGCLRWLR